MLDKINDGLVEWNKQAKKMYEGIDTTIQMINDLDKEVNNTNKELTSQNANLKKLVAQFGAPQNMCVNIVLLLVLIGLASIIYYLTKSSN